MFFSEIDSISERKSLQPFLFQAKIDHRLFSGLILDYGLLLSPHFIDIVIDSDLSLLFESLRGRKRCLCR